MAKKFTKANMYEWIPNANDVQKLREIDAKAGALIEEKKGILKKASKEYKSKNVKAAPKRTPKAGKRFSKK
jgi:hypothetical protein